ncbi:MAG: hypothetical protein IJ752_08925 [Alphaproteobacteria bacterium]|nr:hypothetical protein [Alphaproteobacteria bacterium]
MKNILYRLWKHLDKRPYASSFLRSIHKYLSTKLIKQGKIDTFYPLLKKYKINQAAVLPSYKKFFCLQLFENVLETLVVGSSHGVYGYWAEEKFHEINACGISQDLYYSYEIYKKYADAPRLKNIVIFYSVFSPGFVLEISYPALCDAYYYFYEIPYRFRGKTENNDTKEAFSLFVSRIKRYPDFHYIGNTPSPNIKNLTIEPQKRAKDHLKGNKRNENQTAYIMQAAKLAKEKGHHLYIVIPPGRSDYTSHLPSFEELFAELLKLEDQVKILNFFRDERFSDSDFSDTDHLNEHGAKKLSAFIRKEMK